MIFLIGITLGLLLGLTGAGGSIFAVPMLVLLVGASTTDAMTMALAAVSVSAAYGALLHRKKILWFPSLFISMGGFITAPLGKWLASSTSDITLSLLFSTLALAISIRMIWQARTQPESTAVIRGLTDDNLRQGSTPLCRLSKTGRFQLKLPCISGMIFGGLVVGLASGFFGVGGGFLIVPLLLWLSQISMSAAVASSLFSIAVITGTALVSSMFSTTSPPNLTSMLLLSSAAILGMMLSKPLGKKLAGPKLQTVFATLLIVTSVVFTLRKIL